jgi:hypothetical protein
MKNIVSICLALIFMSCATVPQAAVDLSVQLENQLHVLKQANEAIINAAFDSREQSMNEYIDDVLLPKHLEVLFKNPGIVEYWNQTLESNDASDRYSFLLWLNRNIQKEHRAICDSLLQPIQEERHQILKSFDEEFDSAIRMNSTVTRNISSVSEIQKAYEKITSKFVDTNKLDTMLTNSLRFLDAQLNSAQKGIDAYENNKDKIENIFNKLK